MSTIFTRNVTLIWFLLLGLTLASWYAADTAEIQNPDTARLIASGLLVLAYIKVRMVLMRFMEVRRALPLLRVAMEVWTLATTVLVLVLYNFPMS